MRILTAFPVFLLLIVSCRKEAVDDFMWEKSFGPGNAYFISHTADNGIVSAGMLNEKPYLLKLSNDKSSEIEFTSEADGLFSSLWFDDNCYIAGGSSNGKMLLAGIDDTGYKIWDATITADFYIDLTRVFYTVNGNMLAVGSASPDSYSAGATGLLFVWFDTTGSVTGTKELTESSFISANDAAVDNSGNIYLSLTRKTGEAKTKASVAKYNSDIQKLWETELYNNTNFGASGRGIIIDGSGNVFVTGKTEVSKDEGTLDESFLASLSGTGTVRWKKYLENSNSGSALVFNNSEILMLLNRNCFVINMADPEDGADAGRLRMFDVCDPYDTDAFGSYLDIDPDNNLLLAGSKGNSYYLAVKAGSQ